MNIAESRIIQRADDHLHELAGVTIPADWWSRPYEYAFAIQHAAPDQVVADMGCGWMPRPFKDALSAVCEKVYAIDADPRLLGQPKRFNMEFIVADFAGRIASLPDESLDRVFCVSVLEDLQNPIPALTEFARVLKPDGLIVITCDIPWRPELPTPTYPGINPEKLLGALAMAGLEFVDGCDLSGREEAVRHETWNLCVLRCLLKKR